MYEGMAKEVVYGLKFGRKRMAARDIALALAARFSKIDATLVSHIPTAPSRVRQRGYDQAALIARALARELGLPYAPLLMRLSNDRQVGRTRIQRRQQMRGAFRVTRPELLNQHVLLIDDVLTTGATCEAAAQTLQKAGAKRVSAAVFAAA
ncbi:MAG TPA: phosphoribosyltransferase family protein [Bacillota bacterium]|nr:phosphoribosyltransferase family protein [Bacillota bacterium]